MTFREGRRPLYCKEVTRNVIMAIEGRWLRRGEPPLESEWGQCRITNQQAAAVLNYKPFIEGNSPRGARTDRP
jgi:hypothetical protein